VLTYTNSFGAKNPCHASLLCTDWESPTCCTDLYYMRKLIYTQMRLHHRRREDVSKHPWFEVVSRPQLTGNEQWPMYQDTFDFGVTYASHRDIRCSRAEKRSRVMRHVEQTSGAAESNVCLPRLRSVTASFDGSCRMFSHRNISCGWSWNQHVSFLF